MRATASETRTALPEPSSCRQAIDDLLRSHADALRSARDLPWASVVRVEVHRSTRGRDVEHLSRRVLVRPVVVHEVRRQIVASLAELGAALDDQWLETRADPDGRERSELRAALRDTRNALDRRGPGRRAFDRLPVVPVVGALVLAWFIRPPAARPTVEELYSALVGVLVLLQGRAIVALAGRPFGAGAARALLQGGVTDRGPGAYGERRSVALEQWLRWPFTLADDATSLACRAHAVCGVAPPRRAVRDLLLTPWHLATIGALGLIALGVVSRGAGRIYLAIGGISLVWCLAGTATLVTLARRRMSHREPHRPDHRAPA